jgi:hypothetical protein
VYAGQDLPMVKGVNFRHIEFLGSRQIASVMIKLCAVFSLICLVQLLHALPRKRQLESSALEEEKRWAGIRFEEARALELPDNLSSDGLDKRWVYQPNKRWIYSPEEKKRLISAGLVHDLPPPEDIEGYSFDGESAPLQVAKEDAPETLVGLTGK